ncbi:hypothetical protein BU24DRAFT_171716 [Aaosphaeria arxii CBS 175.79]|uniref:Uncharacterized protein n=1 Tax=Aaosphaeria arxii CBS 175.79 TaxID=1450172 RepID=A0A6A5Y078_9PLEO|nr:uncharacterized protein BU24DRAFT_171716 [Aaosphaeria arxii CBS 175.79]KAF2018477.1 hypothetical protein BU24DRAFT_171716 [Aaosphaeria arxii CBS 175.79]
MQKGERRRRRRSNSLKSLCIWRWSQLFTSCKASSRLRQAFDLLRSLQTALEFGWIYPMRAQRYSATSPGGCVTGGSLSQHARLLE